MMPKDPTEDFTRVRDCLLRCRIESGSQVMEALERLERRRQELEEEIREHWRERTHGLTANMEIADQRLHTLLGLD